MPIIIPTVVTATRESHILDTLDLADGVLFDLAEAPVFQRAQVRHDMVGGIDVDGSVPLDEGHYDNAVLTLPLMVQKQATADLAWNKVGLLVSKLQECARRARGLAPIEHLWTPKDATDTWILRVMSGEILEMPMDSRGANIGYLLRSPRLTVVLQCAPSLYRQGELINFTEVTSTEPVFSITLADVPGHVDAEATVTVTDNAIQSRRHIEGGLGPDSAAPLLIDSASLVTIGFAGAAATRTGAYSANGVVRAILAARVQAICGTGNLGHVGLHRVKARIYATSFINPPKRLRFAYRTAGGDYSYTPWVVLFVEDDFCEVDFGTIMIREVTQGAQQWDGRIEAYDSGPGAALEVDYIEVLPADLYWKVRTSYLYQAGLLVGRDEFTSITAATVLNGRVAPLGGTWVNNGAGADFVAADGPLSTDETVKRTSSLDTNYEFGILGSTTYIDTEVGADVYTDVDGAVEPVSMAVTARWVDANNYVSLGLENTLLNLAIIVAGSPLVSIASDIGGPANNWYQLRLVVYASGRAHGTLLNAAGAELGTLSATHSSLATGGALDDGKVGLADANTGTIVGITRYYDNFYVATPTADPIALYSGQSIEFRHDSCERESADGLTWGVLSPSGGRVYVPCAGDSGGSTRLWTKARRNDVDVVADDNVADSTKLDVVLRPRYLWPTNP